MVDPATLAAFSARFTRPNGIEKRAHPGAYAGPDMPASWEAFAAVLTGVGGRLLTATPDVTSAIQAAIDLGSDQPTGRIVASVAAASYLKNIPNITIAEPTTNPHGWEDVDLAIVTAEAACAENASLLLSSASLPERALAFLAQRLLVLVPEDSLVGGFMAAQAAVAARYGAGEALHHVTWMSGPSKTADIEQTLVIGAHGVCALAVLPVPRQ